MSVSKDRWKAKALFAGAVERDVVSRIGMAHDAARRIVPQDPLDAAIGIAIPLFIVTMASQNIPGFAVLKVNGYTPAPAPLFRLTGLFTMGASFFGGHAVNLSALTAAMT